MKKIRIINRTIILFVVFSLSIVGRISAQYGVGDYGSTSSGNYNVISTWSTWNGAAWVPAVAFPNFANSVFILTGRTVVLPATGPYSCNNLTVEAGAKLWAANSGTNIYMQVYGSSLVCDGQIGDGATFDGISLNIEGANCTISGTGQFDISRLRKFATFSTTTNLIIARDINLRFNSGSTTQLYNNTAGSIFNVTINPGAIVTLFPNGPSTGNVCIDGINGLVNASATNVEAGGTFTVNGSLIISGILYLTTNNVGAAYLCKWVINGLVRANEIVASNSGAARDSLIVNAGGKLEITGTPAWSTLGTTNNGYVFNNNSTVEYSAAGNQLVRVASEFLAVPTTSQYYGHLTFSGSGNKSTALNNLWVKNNLTITGSAVLDPNPGNSNIFVGGNWTNYNSTGFSEKLTTVYINGGAFPQFITCPGGETFNVLRYGKTGLSYLQFNNTVTVVWQLLFASNGYVDLNSNSLIVNNPTIAGIQGGNFARYIVSEKMDNSSKITWKIGTDTNTVGIYTFPFGIPPGTSTNYVPVYIRKSNTGNIGDVTISTYGTPPDNQTWPIAPTTVTNLWADTAVHNVPDNRHWTVDRFWQINTTSPVPLDSLIFTYRAIELPDSDQNALNLGAQYWNTPIGFWNRTQYGIPSANRVAVPVFLSYNTAWTLTSLTSPLPIELLSFNAEPEESKVVLRWSTATEINNDYFTLEKSIDGKEFFEFGKVAGAGNSNQTLEYFYDDLRPFSGTSYYRLKQTDYDGHFSYSEVIPVNFRKQINNYSVYPNPAGGSVYLIGESEINSEVFIRNAEGKTVNHFILERSTKIYPLNISTLSSGVYIIEIISKYETQYLRLMKN